jgi:alkaline phosphatase D
MAIRWSRRHFMTSMLGVLACSRGKETDSGAPSCDSTAGLQTMEDGSGLSAPDFTSTPFLLGVASGAPLQDRIILWTRLYLDPEEEDGLGGVGADPVPVRWEIAVDEAFQQIVDGGIVATRADLAHSVHIDAGGLEPDSWYHYRFQVGDWISPIGRTRTAPCPGARVESLRIAATTCQRYEHGFFTALSRIPADQPDLIFQLGDYIYEYGYSEGIRTQPDPAISDLAGYRRRYALYKQDLNLQAAHATCPWEVIWDDHEVKNNYHGEDASEEILALMEAAYQAYYENMPLRLEPPQGPGMQIFRRFDWGDLARIHMLDTRQYRSQSSCEDPAEDGCPALDDPTRTMLGDEQEEWLEQGLLESNARWNLIGQQVVMSNFAPVESLLNFDQWDGYPQARQRFLDFVSQNQIPNVLLMTGDIHIGGVMHIHRDPSDFSSEVVAAEMVTPSISSSAESLADTGAIAEYGLMLQDNVHFVHAVKRGYILLELERDTARAHFQMAQTVMEPESAVETEAVFALRSGSLAVVEEFNSHSG